MHSGIKQWPRFGKYQLSICVRAKIIILDQKSFLTHCWDRGQGRGDLGDDRMWRNRWHWPCRTRWNPWWSSRWWGRYTAGVVLQFSQRKLWPPPQPFLIHLKQYFCINKPRKRKQRKFYLWWKVSLHPLHLSVLLALLKPFWHTGHFLPFVGFLPLLLLFLTEEDGPLANGFLTGSSIVSDIDKGHVSLRMYNKLSKWIGLKDKNQNTYQN